MATNGAQPSANNNAMIVRTTNDRPNFSQVLTNLTLGNSRHLTPEQQEDYREYLVANLYPGLETRGMGNTTIWAEMLDSMRFTVIPPEAVSDMKRILDGLSNSLPPSVVRGFRELHTRVFEAIDTAVPRLVESLQNELGLQLEIHTMNQQRVGQIFEEVKVVRDELQAMRDELQAMHDELRKRLDDFDQQALDRAAPLAQAISDEVVNGRLKGMFVPFKTDVDARVRSHKSANEKQQREFEATLNSRIDNINARIDNTTKTHCEKALQPHLKELDDAKATVASFRKQLGQHVTDADTTLGRLKRQQTSNASEMETLRKNHSNFVLSNSSDFQTLRASVEKRMKSHEEAIKSHDEAIKSQDEAIEKINNDIVRIKKNGLDVLSAVKIVGQRSRSNREVLRKTLRHVIDAEHVALKIEELLVHHGALGEDGFLKPDDYQGQDYRLKKTAYAMCNNDPLENDPACIALLQPDQAPAQAAGAQAPTPAS